MSNQIKVGNTTYVNLATHPVTIKSGENIYEWGKYKGAKPDLVSRYKKLDMPITTYIQVIASIENLPDEKENTIYIVPLFIVNGLDELVKMGKIADRRDIASPGRKVFGKEGALLFADGLRAR